MTGRHIEHVAHAEQLLRSLFAENGAAVDLGSDLKTDTGREVGFDYAGNDVNRRSLRRQNQVNAGRARHLRQTLNRRFHFLAGHQHQIGHFVDHDHNIRQRSQIQLLLFKKRRPGIWIKTSLHRAHAAFPAGPQFRKLFVVTGNVADIELSHRPVAVFHFLDRPFQTENRFGRIGNHRRQQMRNAVVNRKLQHFRVDHDQFAFIRPHPVQKRQNHRIHTHRFARTGGTGYQQVRHFGQIGINVFAADVFAQNHVKGILAVLKTFALEQFAQPDDLAGGVRQFDADGVGTGNHRNPHRNRGHRTGRSPAPFWYRAPVPVHRG